jgi:hypothetical protein
MLQVLERAYSMTMQLRHSLLTAATLLVVRRQVRAKASLGHTPQREIKGMSPHWLSVHAGGCEPAPQL